MIRITQLKLHAGAGPQALEQEIKKTLHLRKGEAFSFDVLRRSIDARKKPELYEIYTVLVSLQDPDAEKRILRSNIKNTEAFKNVRYKYSDVRGKTPEAHAGLTAGGEGHELAERPVIIGTGPAGLFCGLLLARKGLCPILIEQGRRAALREKDVLSFWEGGSLDPVSNVQFGEGGAGTFSDGKLNTGVKDPEGRIRFILETFVQAGASPDIMYSSKPHVGTDVLKKVVSHITDEICERGGTAFFETRMERICRGEEGIWTVECRKRNGDVITLFTRQLVLAVGHSARDTFDMLHGAGIAMSPKSFAVGVRVQHPQSMIDRAMYGENPSFYPGVSSYRLTHRLAGGRGVYSFCMCPGGYVVNASSEDRCLAVNGMSYHDRASGVTNSAIVVTVSVEDILEYIRKDTESHGPQDPLCGVRFQRMLEQSAFAAGNGMIPVQRFSEFSQNGCSRLRLPDFEPKICGRWKAADVRGIFPERISAGIEEGILAWERQIEGFSSADAIVCAAESRTSSPVRIERGHDLQAPGFPGLYPCGEGAGYAGGITSAAADGLRCAEHILLN